MAGAGVPGRRGAGLRAWVSGSLFVYCARLPSMSENAGRLRLGVLVAIALVVSAALVTPAAAQTRGRSRSDRRISISGDVFIAGDETVNGPVVAIDGSA